MKKTKKSEEINTYGMVSGAAHLGVRVWRRLVPCSEEWVTPTKRVGLHFVATIEKQRRRRQAQFEDEAELSTTTHILLWIQKGGFKLVFCVCVCVCVCVSVKPKRLICVVEYIFSQYDDCREELYFSYETGFVSLLLALDKMEVLCRFHATGILWVSVMNQCN